MDVNVDRVGQGWGQHVFVTPILVLRLRPAVRFFSLVHRTGIAIYPHNVSLTHAGFADALHCLCIGCVVLQRLLPLPLQPAVALHTTVTWKDGGDVLPEQWVPFSSDLTLFPLIVIEFFFLIGDQEVRENILFFTRRSPQSREEQDAGTSEWGGRRIVRHRRGVRWEIRINSPYWL